MLMVWMVLNSCSPPKYTLYLGSDTNTRFDKDIIGAPGNPACPFMSFLGYGNYDYHVLDSNFEAQKNRDGIILSEKDTKYYNTVAETYFGNSVDSCFIGYSVTVKDVHIGRSALLSLLNFASVVTGNGSGVPQQPYNYLDFVTLEGKMQLSQHYGTFFFEKNAKTRPRPSWLIVNGDTLRFSVVKQAVKSNGKIKKCKWGVQLQHGDTIYGAVSFYPPNKEIYISRQLNREERIMAGAYLSIMAYYYQ